jgi:hypothetical protein
VLLVEEFRAMWLIKGRFHQAEKQDIKEIDQSATSPSGMKTELKGRVNSNDQSQPEHSGSRGDDGEAGKEGR